MQAKGGRSFDCGQCRAPSAVCSSCERGQLYCSSQCRAWARTLSVRRARSKHRRSDLGAKDHRDRERVRRATRRSSVADHPSKNLSASPQAPSPSTETHDEAIGQDHGTTHPSAPAGPDSAAPLGADLSHKDVRRLWQLIDGFAEQVSVALPVDAPLPWFDLWTLRTGYAPGNRLSIHFFRSHRGVYLAGREV